nr:hypothetical protein FFPRI1PSEUD_01020 [Pseudomonas sp. FFPRI_1]
MGDSLGFALQNKAKRLRLWLAFPDKTGRGSGAGYRSGRVCEVQAEPVGGFAAPAGSFAAWRTRLRLQIEVEVGRARHFPPGKKKGLETKLQALKR